MVQTDWGSGSGSDDPGLCHAEWADCPYGDVDCRGAGSALRGGPPGHVNVTLTATLNPPAQNVRFQWDFRNDGRFDTRLSPNPTVTTYTYHTGENVTAVVRAVKGSRRATDPVTFSVLVCP